VADAELAFREAERFRNAQPPEARLLYSGSRYCDLLLDQGEYQEVRHWVEQRLAMPFQAKSLLNEALDHLSLGKCYLLEARRDGSRDYAGAAEHLQQTVEGLRRAGRESHVPRGLLIQAELCRVTQQFESARSNIEEALVLAKRGGMQLCLTDCYLAYSRLHLALGEKVKSRQTLDVAKDIIQKTGYHRRDREVAELEAVFL
jgi:hypothetical protein